MFPSLALDFVLRWGRVFVSFFLRFPVLRRRIALGEVRSIRLRMGECPRRILRSSPGGPKGSNNLPWDVSSIQQKSVPRPEGDGLDGEPVCAKAAGGDTRRGTRSSAIAGSPAVCVNCADGRRPSGSVNGGRLPRGERNTPRRSGSGVSERKVRRLYRLGRPARGARGHAMKKFRPV